MSIQLYSVSNAVSNFHTVTSGTSGSGGGGSSEPADDNGHSLQTWQQLTRIVPPNLSISILPGTPPSESLCLLLEVSKYLIFPNQSSTINEQGKRSVVRQAMLALGKSILIEVQWTSCHHPRHCQCVNLRCC